MSNYELRAASLPHFGQRLSLRILQLFGWKVRYKPLPGPHGVAIVYPHTSNWDFFVGLFGKWALGLPFRWLAKDSIFKGPFGRMLRSWGGVPVDRRASSGSTQRLADTMRQSDWFWLAIAPEGTRSYRPHLRSGFYHLTLTAKVPLLLVYLDYPKKELGVVDVIRLTGDQERDMAAIAAAYHGHRGYHPELAAPIKLAPPRSDEGGTGKQA
ncbi:1-acyl-sn-glycerol-3-phosphate acyltransferase [Massilia sp. CF038]|uniref:1-acyl-sn-glycerol-3-phosphate acyltransferase n=1 Tax=Massilia sp. CF038 TaxID=1881045 RepID=UPI0009179015|nr:1-acyl-sn-glycerol-3-phosphate acyltransferase [Massilia sp. CF038]SHG99722.1 Acyltransferase [Massilia sp. CF038]